MSRLTDDPTDPKLTRGVDTGPTPQAEVYLVLSEEERAKGFVEPVRDSYIHQKCGHVTHMSRAIAETYARNPEFYGATYCTHCQGHFKVGAEGEFLWADYTGISDQKVGTRRAQ